MNREIVKRGPLSDLSKKISELSKKLQQPEDEEDSKSEETEAMKVLRLNRQAAHTIVRMQRDILSNYVASP